MLRRNCALVGFVAGILTVSAPVARAADHLDGPRLMANPQVLGNLDVNDVYIFQGANKANTAMIMTLSPAAGVLGPTHFNPGGVYEFKIENNGDTQEDLTIRFAFSVPNAVGQQTYQFAAADSFGRLLLGGAGLTGRNVPVPGGGAVRADLFDDPFFFDLNAFNRFKMRALAGDPNAADEFLKRGVKNIPQNFFGGFNVLAIVLEVPSVRLQSTRTNHKIGVWARTTVFGVQFDRMGRPAINTVLLPDADKDLFNSATPSQDVAFRPIATTELTKLFGNPTHAAAVAQMLLPDIMSFDTSDSDGFLNGRRLTDDVIDAELNLLTAGAVTTDDVPNDSVFSARFPYLGTPNPKKVTLHALSKLVGNK
jgi:hypothetical protein